MAIEVDSTANSSATSTSLTFSHTCSGLKRVLVVGVYSEADTITGVTYNGSALTLLGGGSVFGVGRYIKIFYIIAPSTGANNVVISSSGSTLIQGTSVSYTDVSQTEPLTNGAAAQAGVANTYGQSITTTKTDSWVAFIVAGAAGTVLTNNADTVARSTSGSGFGIYDSNTTRSVGSNGLHVKRNSGSITWGSYMFELNKHVDETPNLFFMFFNK